MIAIIEWLAVLFDVVAITTKSSPKYILHSCVFGLLGGITFVIYSLLTNQYGLLSLNIYVVILSIIGIIKWQKHKIKLLKRKK